MDRREGRRIPLPFHRRRMARYAHGHRVLLGAHRLRDPAGRPADHVQRVMAGAQRSARRAQRKSAPRGAFFMAGPRVSGRGTGS
ncbi:hypothetical protein F01_50056 [Burkholderia cenocepacia]|nr:hypothetical protein F01_50056 [Burkholderia cenocepacia]